MARKNPRGRRRLFIKTAAGGLVRAAASAAIKHGPRLYRAYKKYRSQPTKQWGARLPKQKLTERIVPDGTGSSQSFVSFKKKRWSYASKVIKGTECNLYQYTTPLQVAGAFGFQGTNIVPFMTGTDMRYLANKIATLMGTNTALGMQYLTGVLGSSNSPINTMKFVVQECLVDIFFTNNTSANCFLDLYDIEAREDSTLAPLTVWDNGMGDENAGSRTQSTLYTTPFQSQEFCSEFKIDKVKKIELAQGRSHRHRIKYMPNMVIDMERALNSTNLSKTTRYCIPVCYGLPCNDSVSTGVVSTNSVKLDIIYQVQYKYNWQVMNAKNFTYTSGLSSAITLADIVDIGSGLVATEATA